MSDFPFDIPQGIRNGDAADLQSITFPDGTTETSAGCVGFMCKMTSTGSGGYGAGADLYYDDTLFDTHSGITQNASDRRTTYTIPKAGYWWFGITASGYNSNLGLAVYRNSDKFLQAGQSMSGYYAVVTFGMVECEVGDIITPKNGAPADNFRSGEAEPYFQGFYIGSS